MNKYTLIITEKPDAAERIALALDRKGEPRKISDNGVPYYVVEHNGKVVVVPSLGHLYAIASEGKRRDYPAFSFKWVPRFVADRGAIRTRKRLETITELAKSADKFIDACDYDLEGSLVGYCILKYACGGKDSVAKRMKYSTLTRTEIQRAYHRLLPGLDFGLIEAGCTRHEVDWLYGINLSRALTNAAQSWSGRYTTLTTGRVQGPTLKFVVDREVETRSFVPTPYWQVKAQLEIDGKLFEASLARERVGEKKEADTIVRSCKGKKGRVEKIDARRSRQSSPVPFDLGALQIEAYHLFKYVPTYTLSITQKLYLNALVSYPRTSSQKLPSTIDYKAILGNLSRSEKYQKLATELLAQPRLSPNQGKKDDPAHPAIHPTGNLPERPLENPQARIFDLVIRRFLAAFGKPATRQTVRVCIVIDRYRFHVDTQCTLSEGWMQYYRPYVKSEETFLPPLKEGQILNIKRLVLKDMFTKPQPHYNPASLLMEMEKAGIGTKATRAGLIQTLYDRGYIKGEKIAATTLGFEVCQVLEKHCPAIVSTGLTRELETKMNKIQQNAERREKVLTGVIGMLKPVLENLKEEETIVGEQLNSALERAKREERIIAACPICKNGKLIVCHSRKSGKRFLGCTNYFNRSCKASFPLPQTGKVRATSNQCSRCGWPTVEVQMSRRPWILCFNPECSKERREGT